MQGPILTVFQIVACILCITGVVLFAYVEGFSGGSGLIQGILMAVASAFGAAFYKVSGINAPQRITLLNIYIYSYYRLFLNYGWATPTLVRYHYFYHSSALATRCSCGRYSLHCMQLGWNIFQLRIFHGENSTLPIFWDCVSRLNSFKSLMTQKNSLMN